MPIAHSFRPARRATLARFAALAGLALLGSAAALADAPYPANVIKLVVPTAAGGSVDASGRLLADALSRAMAARVIVDNKAGAGGAIGVDSVVKSPPDGYTLVLGIAATLSVQPAVRNNLPYNATRDLVPIAVFAQGGLVVVVPADSPARNVQDLRALAAKNGSLSFGTGGQATFGHLTGEVIASTLGISMRHIPYRGASPAITDLAGGQLDMAISDAFSALPHVQSGKLRVIATAGPTRHVSFPDVPTLSEEGVPFDRGTWIGLFAPAATPPAIVAQLSAAVKGLSANPAFRADVTKLGFSPVFMSSAEVARMLAQEIEAWKADAKKAAIQLD
ncbi:tripartite tricarboxylate transporter substrate binding protein [Xylophilus sp. GW821-FHT01B05]